MSHSHHHHEAPKSYDRAFALGVGLNTGFVLIEAVAGVMVGSMALLSDAGHNLSDVLALLLAWGAVRVAATTPTERYTYGRKRATVLASLVSAVMLCVALGAIVWEAVGRLSEPAPVNAGAVMAVAGVGVVINAATAWLFASGRGGDLNIRGAYLHMMADAFISLGVVGAGALIMFTGKTWLDPVAALVVSCAILVSAVHLLRESLGLAMDAVPRHIDPVAVREYLSALPGVEAAHDLHIWAMSTTETALTVHLVVPLGPLDDTFLRSVTETLRERFSVQHPTIQLERGSRGNLCASSEGGCD